MADLIDTPSGGITNKRNVRYHDEGDTTHSEAHAAHLRGWDTSGLQWVRVAADPATGALLISGGAGGGGPATIADGADVAQGATTDVAWVSGAGSLVAISKAEYAKLEAIRALLASSLTVTGPLTDTQLRANPVPVSGTFWPGTQPVSGELIADIGTTGGLALDATLTAAVGQAVASPAAYTVLDQLKQIRCVAEKQAKATQALVDAARPPARVQQPATLLHRR